MPFPAIAGLLSAAPAIGGAIANLANSDRDRARELTRQQAEGELARRAVEQQGNIAAQEQLGIARGVRGPNVNIALQQGLDAGNKIRSRAAANAAQTQIASQQQGIGQLNQLGQQQGAMLQNTLGAASGGLADLSAFLGTSGGETGTPVAAPGAPAANPLVSQETANQAATAQQGILGAGQAALGQVAPGLRQAPGAASPTGMITDPMQLLRLLGVGG